MSYLIAKNYFIKFSKKFSKFIYFLLLNINYNYYKLYFKHIMILIGILFSLGVSVRPTGNKRRARLSVKNTGDYFREKNVKIVMFKKVVNISEKNRKNFRQNS